MVRTIATWLLVFSSTSAFAQVDSSDVFKRRVLPLLQSPNQSSCQECHVAGIGIATFLKDSEAATFASLLSSGWINTEKPEQSKLLTFVNRHTDETTADIQMLRERELKALTSWIVAAVKDQELLSQATDASAGIELDEKLIRHLRKDRIVARFMDSIWADVGRCVNCHSPDRNQKLVEEHGEQISWVIPNDPARTLNYLLDHELIDLIEPDKSLVRTKPTLIAEHEGGFKFAVGSEADKRFLSFLRDIAKSMSDGYKSGNELPHAGTEHFTMTKQFLKLTELPAAWSGKLLQVNVYAKTETGWTGQRVATADSEVNAKQLVWMQVLSVTRPKANELPNQIVPGRYRIEFFVDRDDRISKDADAVFTKADKVAELEVDREWLQGFKEPNTFSAKDFLKSE